MDIHSILNEIKVNGEMHSKEFADANIIKAECGTNGYCGGDSGHGSVTCISLKDIADTDWNIIVEREEFGHLKGIKLIAGGDAELETLASAFLWIGDTLSHIAYDINEQRNNGRKKLSSSEKDYWKRLFDNDPVQEIESIIESARKLAEENE